MSLIDQRTNFSWSSLSNGFPTNMGSGSYDFSLSFQLDSDPSSLGQIIDQIWLVILKDRVLLVAVEALYLEILS